MKLKIDKKIEAGSYKVAIAATSFEPDEQLKISKFGSPSISLEPQSIPRSRPFPPLRSLPLHSINHTFTFTSEEVADKFVKDMTERIKKALEELRQKEDKFSGQKEYEL